MSNMSHCRFQNTLQDLRDCLNNMDLEEEASREEQEAQKDLIEVCEEITNNYSEE